MSPLLLKLLLAPLLVGAASLAGRRFGQRVAGLVAALPIVGGPILAFFAWDHGAVFVARAAEQTLAGLVSLATYCVAYGWMAWLLRRRSRRWAGLVLPLAWGVFLVATAGLFALGATGAVSLGLGAAGLLLGARALPVTTPGAAPSGTQVGARPTAPRASLRGAEPTAGVPFAVELGVRMIAAGALVLALTTASERLGPELSGLLTPFPVASTVLLVGAHVTQGAGAAIALLRGFLVGLWGFLFFCAAVAWGAVPLGVVPAFVLGLCAVVVVQGFVAARPSTRFAHASWGAGAPPRRGGGGAE